MKWVYGILLCVLWCASALAQSTGNSFPTPNGQVTSGAALLVPCGPVTNGQPSMCPPGPLTPLPTQCTNCSPSAPISASSIPVNGTIAVTNTFQSLLAQNSNRKGCIVQNQGTHTMFISIASSPTLSNALQVPAGAFFYCSSGSTNIVISDQVWITGTAGDAFAGESQ